VVETFPALWLTALALLPGALFTWSREQQTGRWGVTLADRLLRFVGTSALLHVLLLPLSYWLYARFVVPGALHRGDHLPWWLWPTVLLYVAFPLLLGRALGIGIGRGVRWATWIVGGNPAPRAWDHLFNRAGPAGWVVLKLKDGSWLAGTYATTSTRTDVRSYASRFPEQQDLYLAATADVDENGRVRDGPDGVPRLSERGVLVRWDEVSYLCFDPIRHRVVTRRSG
jgi:Family of unknown function (DUF6338)